MNKNCIKKLSETTFICVVTGLIIYKSYLGEHRNHLPHLAYPTTPPVQTITVIGTATISTTTTTL